MNLNDVEYRNAEETEDGRINCEINHPVYGWIPFTADPDDPESHGKAIFAKAKADPVLRPVDPIKALRMKQVEVDFELADMLAQINPVLTNVLAWEELSDRYKEAYRTYRKEIIALMGKGHTPETFVRPVLNFTPE